MLFGLLNPAWRCLREAAKDTGGDAAKDQAGDAGKAGQGAEDKDPEDLGGLKSALAKTKEDKNKFRDGLKAATAELEALRNAANEKAAADKAAQEAALVEQGKFKELAQSQKEEIERLSAEATAGKDFKAKLEKAEAVLTSTLESRKKALNLPEAVKELLGNLDLHAQIVWLDTHGAAYATGNGNHGGLPTSNADGSSKLSDAEKRARSVSISQLG